MKMRGFPDEETRERSAAKQLGGNLFRCGACPGILAALREASGRGQKATR
jgi:hypothetical protein